MKIVRFARSARKHRVGRQRVLYVMETCEPVIEPDSEGRGDRYGWVGFDPTGVELDIVAVDVPDCLLVIHVMQTHLRRRGRR
jgi:hypothetical protein